MSVLHPFPPRPLPSLQLDVPLLSELPLGSDELREQFLLSPATTAFVNHGSFGTVPRVIMRHFHSLLEHVESNPDHWFRSVSWGVTRAALQRFAQLLQVEDSLVFVSNATTGVNVVLDSVPLQKGDVVLTMDCTYNACKLALQRRARLSGAEYVEMKLPLPVDSEETIVDCFTAELDRLAAEGKRVSFVLVDALTSPTSILMPFSSLSSLCQQRGIRCMVDGAHAIGHIDLSQGQIAPLDAFTTNLHKWGWGPKGSALLYVHPSWRDQVHPAITSHATNESFARRFWQQATRDDCVYLAAAEAWRFGQALGQERCREYQLNLARWAEVYVTRRLQGWTHEQAEEEAGKTKGVDTKDDVAEPASVTPVATSASSPLPALCPPSLRAPFMRLARLPWSVPSDPSQRASLGDQVMALLVSEYQVVAPIIFEPHTNAYWVRFSMQVYNRQEDYRQMVEALLHIPTREEFKHLQA